MVVRRRRIKPRRTYRRRYRRRIPKGIGYLGKRLIKLSFFTTEITSATGVINTTYTDDPSNSAEWASFRSLFDFYRICA